MTLEENQPDYEDASKQPKTLTRSRHIDNVLYVAGRAPREKSEYEIMFITTAVEEDEANTHAVSTFGFRVSQPAEYLKGANGVVKDVALMAGIDMEDCYYTAVCKWLLPRAQRARPSKKVMKWGMPILEDEIARIKPKIIVCLGKPVFDIVGDQKVSFKDAHGCWFWNEQHQAHMYVMHAPYTLVGNPEHYETFRIDFKEIARRRDILRDGGKITGAEVNYQVIDNEADLREWLERVEELATPRIAPPRHAVDARLLTAWDFAGLAEAVAPFVGMSASDAVKEDILGRVVNAGPSRSLTPPEKAAAVEFVKHLPTDDQWPGLRDEEGNPILSVDCEWHGKTHVDGQLRTIQFAWSETEAVVIEFRNEKNEWSFGGDEDWSGKVHVSSVVDFGSDMVTDSTEEWEKKRQRASYAVVGKPIAATLERMGARFIGHHFAADAPWMQHWLGIETYEKCVLDTEFAQQTCDESSELGLERGIAMKYTNLGRYDQALVEWKRENKELVKGGYGYIPSRILHPYGIFDVITPIRAYPLIKRQLEAQRLWDYYRDIFNPFVTDVFTEFAMTGLPMDIPLMDDLRRLFTWTTARLNVKLQERIATEAVQKFKSRVMQEFGVAAVRELWSLIDERDEIALKNAVKELLNAKGQMQEVTTWNSLIHHLVESPRFNIRSPDQMARWLFDFEGLTPIKSTNQKAKGLPSMAWEKVLELPKDRQALYKPAVDKQTLAILSEQLPAIDELLNLNAVGNLSKAFLNEPDVYVDGETGEEVVEEHGLHAWLCSDGRIHGQMSTTETSRSRSWCPNTLNYPSYVNKRIAKTVERCILEAHEEGDLPEELMRWVGIPGEDLPSIRSCIAAPEGMVLVESDYATAEMWALAMTSGDKDLMRLLSDPDPEWAKLKPGHWTGAKATRVAFSDPKLTGVPESARNPEFLMRVWDAGECLGSVADEDLLREQDGNVVHAKYDIHWSLIERTYGRYRETMVEKLDRNAAKVLNFCLCGDSKVPTRDRGSVSIRDIRLDDWLWDGVEWVQHEGVIYTGRKEVIEYQGLRATRLHDVWTVERGKVKLEEACVESLTLVRSEAPSTGAAAEIRRPPAVPGQRGETRERLLLCENEVSTVRSGTLQGDQEPRERLLIEVSVPREEQIEGPLSGAGSGGHLFVDAPLCSDEAEMLHGHACVVAPLSESGDRSGVQGQGRLHRVGSGELHGRSDSVERLRQDRQRRELLPRELAPGRSVDQPDEPGPRAPYELSSGQAVSQGSPGSSIYVENGVGPYENGDRGRRDFDAKCAKFSCGETETYDILNAGPRHRFTCSGVIVSNSSSYGASSNSIERKIESDTGVKPEEGTGERGLEAIAERQPRATQYLEEMARVPKEKGFYRAASGRIRHCPMHSAGSGVGWRTRNAIESSLGRQMRNFPCQESVGATSARACKWLLHAYRQLGLKARPMTCLYDSVVTLCPLEERFLVARLHQICMSDINGWDYSDEHGDRTLRYSIDLDYNWRWSTKSSKADQAKLSDPTFHPASPRLEFLTRHPSLIALAGLPESATFQ
jgi:uracil-DNA glycosylase family 4